MKQLSTILLFLICLVTHAQDTVWQKPIVITKGGIYTGNFKGDGTQPTILVRTSEDVYITGCVIVTQGNQSSIKTEGYARVHIYNNSISQVYGPGGEMRGRSIELYKIRYADIQHNEITGGFKGIYLLLMDDTPFADSIIIKYNRGRNISKAKRDGSNGGDHSQFIQFNTVRGFKYAEVAWNECINFPDESWVEDVFSFINVKGKQPIYVHDNYLEGAYPMPADQGEGFTGSGITVETNDNSVYSDGVIIMNNQVVSMGNALLNITSAANVQATKNRLISASMLPNGVKPRYFWSGTCLYNGSGISEELLSTSYIKDNLIGYGRWNDKGNQYPEENQQAENAYRGNENWKQNRMPPGQNIYVKGPLTKAMETNERLLWQAKISDAKVAIGLSKYFSGISEGGIATTTPTPAPIAKKIFFTATSKGIKYDVYTDGTWKAKDGSAPPVPVKVTTTIEVNDDGTIKIKKP